MRTSKRIKIQARLISAAALAVLLAGCGTAVSPSGSTSAGNAASGAYCGVTEQKADAEGADKADTKKAASDKAVSRMLCLEGELYLEAGKVKKEERPTCGVMDGRIESCVSRDKVPQKDGQSNFGKCGWQYGRKENEINVRIDEKWVRFVKQ